MGKKVKHLKAPVSRLATVKATGARYVVQNITIGATPEQSRVHCWGEVVAYRSGKEFTQAAVMAGGANTTHGPSKCFTMAAVTIAEVALTTALVMELFEQAKRNHKPATPKPLTPAQEAERTAVRELTNYVAQALREANELMERNRKK